jgi:hypothetical protein
MFRKRLHTAFHTVHLQKEALRLTSRLIPRPLSGTLVLCGGLFKSKNAFSSIANFTLFNTFPEIKRSSVIIDFKGMVAQDQKGYVFYISPKPHPVAQKVSVIFYYYSICLLLFHIKKIYII